MRPAPLAVEVVAEAAHAGDACYGVRAGRAAAAAGIAAAVAVVAGGAAAAGACQGADAGFAGDVADGVVANVLLDVAGTEDLAGDQAVEVVVAEGFAVVVVLGVAPFLHAVGDVAQDVVLVVFMEDEGAAVDDEAVVRAFGVGVVVSGEVEAVAERGFQDVVAGVLAFGFP